MTSYQDGSGVGMTGLRPAHGMVRATSTTETRDPAPPVSAVMNRTAGAKDGGLGVWSSAPTADAYKVLWFPGCRIQGGGPCRQGPGDV